MRIQHPVVLQRTDREGSKWFFRYWLDEQLPDGSIKSTRKYHSIGPSQGPGALSQSEAEAIRDRLLAELTPASAVQPIPVLQTVIASHDLLLFGQLAEMWRTDYVDNPKVRLAGPTRYKYRNRLQIHILPRWKNVPIRQMRSKDILDWLQAECASWYMMLDLRNIMSGIFARAQEWEILPDTFANPMRRVKIGRRWTIWPEQILNQQDTFKVLARLNDPHRLICETCLSTGTRISEVLGLTLKHVDLEKGTIYIQQRNCRGDIDVPKTKNSRRILTLGVLVGRYRVWIQDHRITHPEQWIFSQAEAPSKPMWDSGVRKALKMAARAEGCDFLGFGLHSFRRANITWRQEVGASAIEASKIAGHGSVSMTDHYTHVQLKRQEELTRALQERYSTIAFQNGQPKA
jgi:integrase